MTLVFKQKEPGISLLVILLAAVLLVWVLFVLLGLFIPGSVQDKGVFGDWFGSLNALFTALAFAGVIFTVLLQRRELQLQRQELEQTREELKGQKEQLEGQKRQLELQNFEHRFFELLNTFNRMTVIMHDEIHKITGRGCFNYWIREIKSRYERLMQQPSIARDPAKHVDASFLQASDSLPDEASNYFRILYNILKYVDASEVKNPKSYTNLVRALLTENELLVVFYNCLSRFGSLGFKSLMERYAILKYVRVDKLFDPAHVRLYDQSAFRGAEWDWKDAPPLKR